MLGDYTLGNFSFSSSGTGDVNLLSPSEIMVDPTGSSPTFLSVQFTAENHFQVFDGQTAEYIFHFLLDPLLPSIAGPVMDLGPNDPVTLTGEFCGDGQLISAPKATVECRGTAGTGIFPASLVIVGDGNPASLSHRFPSPVFVLDSRIILDITGPGNVTSIGGGGDTTGVPEPSTLVLLAPALAGLAWVRRKLPAGQRA
jgi:hypothetical protein